MQNFKEVYLERYREMLGDELEDFLKAIVEWLPTTVRVNTLKTTKREVVERFEGYGWEVKGIEFYDEALIVKHDKAIGNTLEYYLGYVYGQTLSSMVPPLVLKPKKHEKILDLCAAPGSKTTQMAQLMENTGMIVANDSELKRIVALRDNVQRVGATNVVITQMDGRKFNEKLFDKALADVPCTATGTVMKNFEILKMYNPVASIKISRLQKRLLEAAIRSADEVVYSTCSLEPEENEAVIDWLLKKYDNVKLKKVRVPGINISPALTEWRNREFSSEVKKCGRIWPHKNQGFEGFFIARLVVR